MAAALPVCYHGAITKSQCEDLLGKKNKDGAYLIRDSETIQGAMCLCVYKKKVVHTYRMMQTHSGHYMLMAAAGLEEQYFKTLDDLIHNYKRRNQGLAMHLRHSIKRKTAMLIQHRSLSEPPHFPAPIPVQPAASHGQPGPIGEPEPPLLPARNEIQLHRQLALPEEDHDYENAADLSEYVEVLPP